MQLMIKRRNLWEKRMINLQISCLGFEGISTVRWKRNNEIGDTWSLRAAFTTHSYYHQSPIHTKYYGIHTLPGGLMDSPKWLPRPLARPWRPFVRLRLRWPKNDTLKCESTCLQRGLLPLLMLPIKKGKTKGEELSKKYLLWPWLPERPQPQQPWLFAVGLGAEHLCCIIKRKLFEEMLELLTQCGNFLNFYHSD